MGKLPLETTKRKKRKKKGRPSLIDLQKRSIKQQSQNSPNSLNPNPNPKRRSTRRNPNPSPSPSQSSNSDDEDEEEEEQLSGKQKEKKLNLVLDDDSNANDGIRRKRKFDDGSVENHVKDENHDPTTNAHKGAQFEDGPLTALPDKKLLLFILDRLQKKDSYNVFADPVDPEELPDYHEVIEEPMDFTTIRNKLDQRSYANLEQFERDVFLICSNAMRYNAPDTIYFRQARSIQELAKKDFENLRQESDDNEPETKVVRRGRPPLFKNLKKSLGKPPVERVTSDHSGAALATAADSSTRPSLEARKGNLPEKPTPADSFARSSIGTRHPETHGGWSAERHGRNEEITGSLLKGIPLKHGKKQIVLDDSRRNTYMQPCAPPGGHESSVLSIFNSERKLLIPVGLQAEFGYARSLARFAAKLGPVAWKVASKRITRCLPNGAKFGPGWVGQNEASAQRPMLLSSSTATSQPFPPQPLSAPGNSPSTPARGVVDSSATMPLKRIDGSNGLSEKHFPSSRPSLDPNLCKPPASVSASAAVPHTSAGPSSTGAEAVRGLSPGANLSKGNMDLVRPPPFQNHFRPLNGFSGTFGFNNPSLMGKLVGVSRPIGLDAQAHNVPLAISRTESSHIHPSAVENGDNRVNAKISENPSSIASTDCLPTPPLPKVDSAPPDLNVGFQSSLSPRTGQAKKMQPDLVLQL